MADLIRLSSCTQFNQRFSSLVTSLNNLHPILVPNPNSFKRASGSVDSSAAAAVALVSVAPPPNLCKPGKRTGSLKVQAVVAEATDQPKWWEKNAGPNMIDIHSTEEFLSTLSAAGDRLVVIEFYGTWCASCRALFPKLCRLAKEHPEILFLKVNFDENKAMCKRMNVKVLPYFHLYRGADGQLDGFSCSLAKFQKLKEAIETHNPAGGNSRPVKVVDDDSPDSSSIVEDESLESGSTSDSSSSVEDESPESTST